MSTGVGSLRILKLAGRVPLLTPSEEITLGRQVQAMIILKDNPTPTPEEQRTIKRGIKAKQRMIAANIKLAASIVKHYQSMGRGSVLQLDLEELMQEAFLGLARAVEKFDPERGYKFSTYAYSWIRQSVNRCITRHGRLIRPPVHVAEKMFMFNKVQSKLLDQLGRMPSQNEMADEMGMSVDEYRYALSMTAIRPASLDASVLQDGSPMIDAIVDPNAKYVDQYTAIENEVDRVKLDDIIKSLTPQHREALVAYYGLYGATQCTQAEIARTFSVSRERIRQRIKQAENIIRLQMQPA